VTTYTDPTMVTVGQPNKIQPASLIVLLAGIIAMLYGGFVYWKTLSLDTQKTAIQQQIADHNNQLTALQPVADNLSNLSIQAQGLHGIFDTQIRWENVLQKVQDRLYKNMSVTALQLSNDGSATLSGTTSDYSSYAKIFRSLTDADGQKIFAKAQPSTISRTEAKDGSQAVVIFSFTLTLNSDLLKLTTTNTP
jgi:Tfp pilus assembly protein PilN